MDLIARKGTKVRTPMVSKSMRPSIAKPKPVPMSSPEALKFFGAVVQPTEDQPSTGDGVN